VNKKLLDRLISRRISVALMTFVLGAAVIGVVVPQRSSTSLKSFTDWQSANPGVAAAVGALQMDHVFSSWWFLVGLALFTLSLSAATWSMISRASSRYRGGGLDPHTLLEGVSAEEIALRAEAAGYHEVPGAGGMRRFARHRFGWWGSALMHLGMVVAVIAALVSSAFAGSAIVDFSVGEVREPGDAGYLYKETGPLGSVPEFGTPVRLDRIDPVMWPTGEVKSLEAQISVLRGSDTWEPFSASANYPVSVDGYVVYVSPGEFGDAAFVELSAEGLPDSPVRIEFPMVAAGEPSYSEVMPDGWPVVEARWDPEMTRGDKPLALRVVAGETIHQVVLEEGESAEFGPYSASFEFEGQWARLIIVRPVAVNVIFFGFGVIALGSLMIYVFIPREIVMAEEGVGVRYGWRAARMPHAYHEERDQILGTNGERE